MDSARLRVLEEEARRVLPPAVYAYYRQGSRDETSVDDAVDAWRRHRLVPRVLRDVRTVSTATSLLGSGAAAPLGVAPSTMQRAADPRGEVATAEACAAAGVPLVLSSNATAPFAEVGATGVTWWLQAYLPQRRELALPMLAAAVEAGASAVVLTVDTPVVSTRFDRGEGSIWDHTPPAWLRVNLAEAADAPKARDLGPADIAWIAERTGLPVVPKGVLHPDDAGLAVQAGAAAVWVSNHGGRQLDGAAATADCLAGVVRAVGAEVEVYVDGGIRTGTTVLTALALGARACFLGRLPLYALATGGAAGVEAMFVALREELEEALCLSGCADVHAVSGLVELSGVPSPGRR